MERDQDLGIDVYTNQISIHALRMERDFLLGADGAGLKSISIHALRMERDNWKSALKGFIARFLSTRSAWSATRRQHCCISRRKFLSTRSAWSATRIEIFS